MNKLSPHQMDTPMLMALSKAGTPVIIQSRKILFGIYFPCEFEGSTPSYEEIIQACSDVISECERRLEKDA